MKTKSRKLFFLFLTTAIVVLLISQFSSYLISTHLKIGETYKINSIIFFTHVRNLGGIFGLFQGSGWIFSLFGLLALVGLSIYLFLHDTVQNYEYVCFGCIVGAGLSNILDRVIYGGVVDFINIQHIPYWNYIFNTADVMLHVGMWPIIVFTVLLKKGSSL